MLKNLYLLTRISSCMATKTVKAVKKAPKLNESQFHINNTAYGNKALERWRENGQITDDDARLIEDYIISRKGDKSLSTGRCNKIRFTLLAWRRVMGKPFNIHTRKDIQKGIATLMDGDRSRELKAYSKNVVYDTVTIIKPFYLWMIEQGAFLFPITDFPPLKKEFDDIYSDAKHDATPLSEREKRAIEREKQAKLKDNSISAIKKIARPKADMMTKTVADILSEEEIKRMVEACESSRDRCILMMLFDGGFRIGELGKLTWKQIAFDQYGVAVNVDEKTGKPRYVRLLSASPYIAKWKDDFPFDPTGDNLVFVSHQKKPVAYNAMYRQIRRIAERAGIKKKVHPHIFRHTRVSNLMKKRIPENVIKKMMWGSLTSDMLARYAHLADTHTDDALLEQAGIKRTKKIEDNALAPRQCPVCHLINGPTSRFCTQCGTSLSEEVRQTVETAKARIRKELSPDEKKAALASMTKEELLDLMREMAESK